MRKPHWEEISEIHGKLRNVATALRPEGNGVGLGPITDAAPIRRIRFINYVTGHDLKTSAELAGTFPYTDNEMVGDRPPIDHKENEWVHAQAFATYVMFCKGGERIYKVGREFGEVLNKADLEVRAELIPETGIFFCVEFPENMRFHDPNQDDYFHCAYIAVQKADTPERGREKSGIYRPVDRHGKPLYAVIEILLPCYKADGSAKDEENNTTLCFRDPNENISECINRAQENSQHPIACPEVFEYLMKFLIYLGSGEPDLRFYRAPKPTTENPKKLKRWLREQENRSMVDMTLVGFGWKKPRVYQVGETTVTGHPRWQPYGPRKEKVKLIWIEPHIRHYKKESA